MGMRTYVYSNPSCATGFITAWLTSSLFNVIVDTDVQALTGIRHVLVGGEALSTTHVAAARRALRTGSGSKMRCAMRWLTPSS